MTQTISASALWPETPRPALSSEIAVSPGNLAGTRRSWRYRQPAVALVSEGYFGYRTEREERIALPGLLIVGNAGDAFEAEHCAPQGHQRQIVFFDQHVLEEVARVDGLEAPRFTVSAVAPGKPSALLSAWIKILCAHPPDEAVSYRLASRLLKLGRPSRAPAKPPPHSHAGIRRAVLYIQSHFGEPCSLEALAAVSGMSRYHFLRGFQRLVGLTPRQYVLHTRLVAAGEKLIATNEPIAQIALEVGFNDLSHFYSLFRERFGLPPARWRQSH